MLCSIVSTIVIGIDFSPCGQGALQAGVQLAIDLQAPIIIAHAFPRAMSRPMMAGMGFQDIFQQFATENEVGEALQLTAKWANKARESGLPVDVVAEPEEPARLLVRLSKRADVSMLVVGTHGRGGLRKAFLGSVAQDVIRRSETPVLVVPE